jgi:hypothetical protein
MVAQRKQPNVTTPHPPKCLHSRNLAPIKGFTRVGWQDTAKIWHLDIRFDRVTRAVPRT